MNKEELITEIRNCFQVDTKSSIEHIIRKDCSNIMEANEIKNSFQNFTRETINNQILLENKAALGYLTDDSFIYYLPAYMKLLITEFEKADVIIDSLTGGLTLPSEIDTDYSYINYKMDEQKKVDLEEYFRSEIKYMDDKIHNFIKKTALLSYEQSRCVLNFLEYLNANYCEHFEKSLLEKIIKRYWFKFR